MGEASDRRNFLRVACKTGLTLVGLGVIVGNRDRIASKTKEVLDAFDPIPSNEGIEKMIDGYVNDSVFDSYLADVVNERTIPDLEERLFVIRCINDSGSSQEVGADFFSEESAKVSVPSAPVVLLDRVSIMQELRNHHSVVCALQLKI
jgi:hypothetical protein